jgi:Mg-chelatase subunit ChlD
MKRQFISVVAVLTAFLLSPQSILAADKSRYDLEDPPAGGAAALAKTSSATGLSWKLTRTVGELAVSSGSFFTMGTSGGLSASRLDDRCGITFGHPYARTSYAVMCIDGTWGKAQSFFDPDSERVEGGGDSLVLSYRRPGVAALRVVFSVAANGSVQSIRSQLTNLDSVAHSLALGYAFDPALGIRGDGFLSVGALPILRDTALQSIGSASCVISERNTFNPGLRVSLGFPDQSPDKLIAANWGDRAELDGPAFTPSEVRKLYDLALHMSWTAIPVPAGTSITRSLSVTILPPDFGTSVFLRWDLPDHISMNDGIAFPVSIPSTVTASNLTAGSRSGTLSVSGNRSVSFDGTAKATTLGSAETGYVKFVATPDEVYQSDVVYLVMRYSEGGVGVDSVMHPLLIPATPVADTGLVVTIDSIAAGHFPEVTAFVEVQRQATGQYVYDLAERNIALYDNASRIADVSILRDTTGGVAQRDIVFVLDVTGSMGNAIQGVKSNIIEFADSLTAAGVSYRLGMVTFLDVVENVYDFTTDAAAFKNSVAAQYAHGGGDAPENSLEALSVASDMAFSPTAHRLIIWITDNSYHEADGVTPRTRAQVIARLLEKNITVYAIGALSFQTDWYNPIVNATGGKYYNYLGNFRDILVDISRFNTSRRLMLTYTAPQATSSTHDIALTVHYAGRGGTATSTYAAPGGAAATAVLACYPNPFNPRTTVRLEIPPQASAELLFYDCLGRAVRRLVVPPGGIVAECVWDARDDRGNEVATGVYFVRATILSPGGDVMGNAMTKILYLK